MSPAHVLTLDAGKVRRLEVFPDRERNAVLEARGLQNVATVRRIYDQWSRGDFGKREAFSEDLEFEMSGWVLLQTDLIKVRGIDGMAHAWREVLRGWDDFRTGPIEELIEVGDQIVVFCRVGGRGRGSGVEVNSQRGAVFTFREGKIARLFLANREEALEAGGLSMQDSPSVRTAK